MRHLEGCGPAEHTACILTLCALSLSIGLDQPREHGDTGCAPVPMRSRSHRERSLTMSRRITLTHSPADCPPHHVSKETRLLLDGPRPPMAPRVPVRASRFRQGGLLRDALQSPLARHRSRVTLLGECTAARMVSRKAALPSHGGAGRPEEQPAVPAWRSSVVTDQSLTVL
jgi:hypothetical protein